MTNRLKIALVYDLRDDYLAQGLSHEQVAEFDSPATIEALAGAIGRLGHSVEKVGNGLELTRRLVAGDRWDLVFNIAEGMGGRSREAQVPAVLELFGLRYTFSDPLVCAITLDKPMTKRVLLSAGLPTPRFAVAEQMEDLRDLDLEFPLFVKPAHEGTGKGIDADSQVRSPGQLQACCLRIWQRFRQPVLIEEYLPGREFTSAVLGTGRDAYALGTMEIRVRPDAPQKDYGFQAKEQCEQFVDYLPVPQRDLRAQLEELALKVHRLLGCRDASRVDIRLDNSGRPSILEINPLPGLHPTHSDLPMIASYQGLCYDDLIGRIIESAMVR
jgi:D-alanine-D-alanine ligase